MTMYRHIYDDIQKRCEIEPFSATPVFRDTLFRTKKEGWGQVSPSKDNGHNRGKLGMDRRMRGGREETDYGSTERGKI